MSRRLFEVLAETGGLQIPLKSDGGWQANERDEGGSGPAPFPAHLVRKPASAPTTSQHHH
jgi:hypothetical protein